MRRGALAAIASIVLGCGTEGAVLELELRLPPTGTECGADRAGVQAVFERDVAGAGDCPFATDWAAGDAITGLALESTASTARISIVAGEGVVAQALCVKICFDAIDACHQVGYTPRGAATLRVEPAFLEERYTELAVTIADACATQALGTHPAVPIP
jgi:hypothetical protein